ncbi:PRC-barrel domain-containing protein [Breoghania sp.]|uniref:PRC-barrel domain-containing protein n=1 Tax=Breoghania sp. TaxID=2065378 RepID=UPI002613DBE0|nr:PRC-barrel domain-containing protein [Breoghania sp.]MDJ0931051.1 PRC-barrel domain-containing protein [Breoghania sp.]
MTSGALAGDATKTSDPAQDKASSSLKVTESVAGGELAGTNSKPTIVSADDVIGTPMLGMNDAELSEVNDVILSTRGNLVAYVIDVGGFLGIGEKPVALDASKLKLTENADGEMQIKTSLSEDKLKSYPAYSQAALEANSDAVVVR